MPSAVVPARETPFGRPGSPLRWGLFVAACCLALLLLHPVYDTNDDPAFAELLAGAVGGRSYDVTYLGRPLSAALQGLYAVAPAIPWYGLVLESCNLLAAGMWASLIASCRLGLPAGLAATGGLLIGCSYLVLRVNFMATAFALFLAGVAWLWKLQLDAGAVRWRQAWLGAAFGAAYLIRPSLRWILVFFALPCLSASLSRRNLGRLALVAAGATFLVVATEAGERQRRAESGAGSRAAFNVARSLLVDIPREPTPEALAAAGWSRGDYELAVRFGVYDEEIFGVERIRAFLAEAVQAPRFGRYARTAALYLRARFHLLSLAALACIVWLLRGGLPDAQARRLPRGVRILVWAWLAAGTLALVVTRYPPRAFVPLYLFLGALAGLLTPPRRPRGLARFAALGAVALLLAVALVFWTVDSRAGTADLAADTRELAAGVAAAAPGAILVPIGEVIDTRYTAVLTPPARRQAERVAPGGWVVATPAMADFLRDTGFGTGSAFMRALATDPRLVFVVRRSRREEAAWLLGRLAERYSPGGALRIDPIQGGGESSRLLFFRIGRTAGRQTGA